MVEEAEEFAEEDRIVRERIQSRNGFESYLYNLKSHLEDEDRAQNLTAEEKRELLELVEEKLDWMEDTPDWVVKQRKKKFVRGRTLQPSLITDKRSQQTTMRKLSERKPSSTVAHQSNKKGK